MQWQPEGCQEEWDSRYTEAGWGKEEDGTITTTGISEHSVPAQLNFNVQVLSQYDFYIKSEECINNLSLSMVYLNQKVHTPTDQSG